MLLIPAGMAVFHMGLFVSWTNDDAFISFRYAENWAAGKGLVFNAGERVEGFSNLLWVALLTAAKKLGFAPVWTAKVIALLFSLGLLLLLFHTALALGLDARTAFFCALLLSLSSSFAYFAMSGLETVLYAFLLLLAVRVNRTHEQTEKPTVLLILYGILLAAALTRPEGLLALLVTSGYHIFRKVLRKKTAGGFIQAQVLVYTAVTVLLWLRYFYYSDLLPNTFYAKPRGVFVDYGQTALFKNLSSGLLTGSFLLAGVIFLLIKPRDERKGHAYPLVLCLPQLLFMAYAGDWMSMGRFFLPLLPLTILLFFAELSRRSSVPLSILLGLSAVLLTTNALQTKRALANRDAYPFLVMHSAALSQLGSWLKDHAPNQTVIALKRQGAIPYHSGLESIDILGLTDKAIAKTISRQRDSVQQAQQIAANIRSRKPDLLILFAYQSSLEGWTFDDTFPDEKMDYLESILYQQALAEKYTRENIIPLGSKEKAYLLLKPSLHEVSPATRLGNERDSINVLPGADGR